MKIVYADNVPLNIREECDYWFKTKTLIENFESNSNNDDSFGVYLIGLGYKLIARTFGYEVVSFNDWVKKEIEEYPDCKKLLREYLERHKFSESEINDIFGL